MATIKPVSARRSPMGSFSTTPLPRFEKIPQEKSLSKTLRQKSPYVRSTRELCARYIPLHTNCALTVRTRNSKAPCFDITNECPPVRLRLPSIPIPQTPLSHTRKQRPIYTLVYNKNLTAAANRCAAIERSPDFVLSIPTRRCNT
jgi:hypothetical protein